MAAEKETPDKTPVLTGEVSTASDDESAAAAAAAQAYRETERRILRKADRWLVGFYSLVYVLRVIDSANYANAAIINLEHGTGIKKQLGFSPSQWAWTQSIFSYSYMIFEPSSTILLKTFRPSRWMFVLILAWGISASASSAVTNFKGTMCARFAIGVAEAGFYPAVLYHMAFWYKPQELPQRIAIFYSAGQLSYALSGLLAYAISFMDGLGGLAGWRWLFLLEGLPAILLSFIALFFLPDYPENSKLLTPEEREFMNERLDKRAPSGKLVKWDVGSLKALLQDPTFYTFALYWVFHGIGGFGVGYALPTVIYQLGFTSTAPSQLMNIPPYVCTFLYLNTIGFLLHRKIIRPWSAIIATESTMIVCYIILVTVKNAVVKYLALIVAVSCAGSAYPIIWPERMRILEGTLAAGFGIGFTNAMAQFSGIVGPQIYSTIFGPTYRISYLVCLSLIAGGIVTLCGTWAIIDRRDQRKASRARDA